jgi:hypothetical protein
MPIPVRHIPTQKVYILLGPAFSMAITNRNNLSWETGYFTSECKQLVVADNSGEMSWLPAMEFVVESIDGRTCRDVLAIQ